MSQLTRRDFLIRSAMLAGAASLPGCASFGRSRALRPFGNEPVRYAGIGAGGKGFSDIMEMFNVGGELVAICDVDTTKFAKVLERVKGRCPNVRVYQDYRKMLDVERDLHAVTVSTPDHMHAPASMAAIERGLSVYCQKPLTWCVAESRALKRAARAMGVTTQMGNQGSATEGLRRAIEVIQAGFIGDVTEVYAWTNRPIWPQGQARPEGCDPVPPELDWNLWLGVAPERPFKAGVYHGFKWRGFKDFGTGALGDMACHILNMTFRALKLRAPTVVEPELDQDWPDMFPSHARVRFEFPAREGMPPLTLFWSEGGWKPDVERVAEVNELMGGLPDNGVMLRGTKGMIFQADDYGDSMYVRLKDDPKATSLGKHPGATPDIIPVTLPRTNNHYKEWLDAVSTGAPTFSSFDIAGDLTEFVQIGCLAQRVNHRIEWDGKRARVTNLASANDFVGRDYRKGW